MSFAERTPLNTVLHELWRHTDRNPLSTKAVMAMIREAIDTLGEEESDLFIVDLVKYLDPRDQKKRLGLRNARHLETLGAVVLDEDAARVARLGALCLLGAVAMTPETGIDYSDITPTRKLQIASLIAKKALFEVQYSEDTEIGFRKVAKALSMYTDFPPEDVATELVINGAWDDLHANKAQETLADNEAAEETMHGSQIGEPHLIEFTFGDDLQKTRDAMDWLRIDGNTIEVDARPVLHDGNKVATIIDLTPYNPTLKELMQDVDNDPTTGRQFWNQLGRAVTHSRINGHVNQLTHAKVPMIYMKNKTRSNAKVLRAYFTPFGRADDGTRVIALVAATRTKDHELKALNILCKTKTPRLSER